MTKIEIIVALAAAKVANGGGVYESDLKVYAEMAQKIVEKYGEEAEEVKD